MKIKIEIIYIKVIIIIIISYILIKKMASVFCSPCNSENHDMCRTNCYNALLLEYFGNHHYTCVDPDCTKKNCFILKEKLLYEIKNLHVFCCFCQHIINRYIVKFNNQKYKINKLYLLFLILANMSIDSNGGYVFEVLEEIDTRDIDYWFSVINHTETQYCENKGSNNTCSFPGCNTYKNSNVLELLKNLEIKNEIKNIFEFEEYVDIIEYISKKLLHKHVLTCNKLIGFCEHSDCSEQKLLLLNV